MSKKKVNIELNMTPFIGLFALLVVMLLLTAVWNHITVLSTNTSSTTSSVNASPQNNQKKVSLHVTILSHRLEMSEDEQAINIPHTGTNKVDTMRLVQVLNQWKKKYPDRSDVILNTENTVTYSQLITVFDTLVGNSWPDVGVSTQ